MKLRFLIQSLAILFLAAATSMAIPGGKGLEGFGTDPIWMVLAALGAVGLVSTFDYEDVPPKRSIGYLVACTLGAASFIVVVRRYGVVIGIPLLTSGILSMVSDERARKLSVRLLALTALCGLFGMGSLVWQEALGNQRSSMLLAWLLTPFLSMTGYSAVSANEFIYVTLPSQTVRVGVFVNDVLPLAIILWGGGLLLFQRSIRSLKGLLTLLFGTLLLSLMRWAYLCDFAELNLTQHFRVDERTVIFTLIPVAIVVSLIVPLCKREPLEIKPSNKGHGILQFALCVFATLLAFGWFGVDPGVSKKGRVLVDERNSIWEPSEYPVNTKSFGVRTVYNYTNLFNEMRRYYDVTVRYDRLTDDSLGNVDVLILKCPTSPYEDSEIKSIFKFLERGGGVWLVGDHTNVFGMNIFLNRVAKNVGITFVGDAVVEPNGQRQVFGADPLLAHPVIYGMGDPYLFYTSCSLRLQPPAACVLTGNHLLIDDADYSTNTFFGDFQPQSSEYIGPVNQVAVSTYGKGRVAAWSDSTVFSGFAIYMPGQTGLALGTIDWLNRSNTFPASPRTLSIVGALCLLVLSVVWRPDFRVATAPIALGLGVGVSLAALTARTFYPVLTPKKSAYEVAFLVKPSSRCLPLVAPVDDVLSMSYLTSFIAAQRTGSRPRVVHTLSEAIACPVVVIPGRDTVFDSEYADQLKQYVEGGGTLILLDLLHAKGRERLGVLGLSFGEMGTQASIVTTTRGNRVGRSRYAEIKAFGQPVLMCDGKRIAMTVKRGKGTVFASTTDSLFADSSLGENSAVPNAAQFDLMRILHQLMEPKFQMR